MSSGKSSESLRKEDHNDDESLPDEEPAAVEVPSPPDGGYGWVIVFASFICFVIVDGIIFSFGIFLREFATTFDESKGATAWVASIQTGCYLLAGPVAAGLANAFGCRPVTIGGSLLAAAGFCGAVFANSIVQLYIAIGLFSGIGFGFIFLPAAVNISFYFEKKRAFATGIAVCGSGIGGFLLAPCCQLLVLRVRLGEAPCSSWRAMTLNCCVVGALFRPIEEPQPKSEPVPLKPLLLRNQGGPRRHDQVGLGGRRHRRDRSSTGRAASRAARRPGSSTGRHHEHRGAQRFRAPPAEATTAHPRLTLKRSRPSSSSAAATTTTTSRPSGCSRSSEDVLEERQQATAHDAPENEAFSTARIFCSVLVSCAFRSTGRSEDIGSYHQSIAHLPKQGPHKKLGCLSPGNDRYADADARRLVAGRALLFVTLAVSRVPHAGGLFRPLHVHRGQGSHVRHPAGQGCLHPVGHRHHQHGGQGPSPDGCLDRPKCERPLHQQRGAHRRRCRHGALPLLRDLHDAARPTARCLASQ
ncbi:uncharacterized protein LOC144136214 [Amblyomma americanum]